MGALLSIPGAAGIGVMLLVLAVLSRRLGATHARPMYLGFVVAAGLLFASAGLHAANEVLQFAPVDAAQAEIGWVLVLDGLPAVGITLGLLLAWHYWSWLLAERD
jgi:hypothetical protein